jgi:dipeptidyl aminopeptidase/acylaminoacyl peptidase
MTAKRPVGPDDLFQIKQVNEPDVAQDGTRVVFTLTELERSGNRYRAALWLLNLDNDTPRRLTSGQYRDGQPRWSPDGRSIAFTSDRNPDDKGKGQLWILSSGGGEARRLSQLENSVEFFAWSPDGSQIVCVSKVREKPANPDSDIRHITTIRYKFDGEGFLDDKYRQIFLIDVESGSARQLTEGPFEHTAPAWSPGGYEIAFAANRNENWELQQTRDIHVVRPGSGSIRQLSDGTGSWGNPSWSPDGTQIACTGTRDIHSDSPRTELFVMPAGGGSPESVTSSFDRAFADGCIADLMSYPARPPLWLSDNEISAVYSDRGSVRLARIRTDDDQVVTLTGNGRRVGSPVLASDGAFVYAGNDAVSPGELFICDAQGDNERQLTSFNAEWLETVDISRPESFTVASEDGREVHGWLVKPVGFRDGTKYPLLLQIHGGPFGMYGESFMHEFQMLAGRGYAILYTNPRGSTGYGDDWAHALHLNWGVNDLPDQMAAVDWAIAQGFVDASRLGVLGGSYGGFMTNWIVSHTDRFKAAITMRTLSNLYSAYGTDDIMFNGTEHLFGADPWDDDSVFWKLSPISYVDRIETPLLIIHSEEDYRCPVGQSEELFTALKVRGKTVELVRFPNESHGLSRTGQPKHRIERLKFITDWFERYL